jgi:hypothetical protein
MIPRLSETSLPFETINEISADSIDSLHILRIPHLEFPTNSVDLIAYGVAEKSDGNRTERRKIPGTGALQVPRNTVTV